MNDKELYVGRLKCGLCCVMETVVNGEDVILIACVSYKKAFKIYRKSLNI